MPEMEVNKFATTR